MKLLSILLLTLCFTVTAQTVDTEFKYPDANGKNILIQNSLPKGGLRYTDPGGKTFVYAIFWTSIRNERAAPVELTLHFPADSFALSSAPGTWFYLLLPPDTMTKDKEPLFDFGINDLKSFLDNTFHQSTSLQRTINSGETFSFYVATLYNQGVDGVIRAGLSLQGKELFYTITAKEISCGQMIFKK